MVFKKDDKKVKSLVYYIKDGFKFYDLGIEWLTPVLFVIMLGLKLYSLIYLKPYLDKLVGLADNFSYEELLTNPNIMNDLMNFYQGFLVFLLFSIITYFVSLIYLSAFIKDKKGIDCSFTNILIEFVKKIPTIFIVELIINLLILFTSIVASMLFMIISPLIGGIIMVFVYIFVYVTFIFKQCFIFDKNSDIGKTISFSYKTSKGNRMQILLNIFIIYLLSNFITSVAPKDYLIAVFIFSFFEIIFILIKHRIVALMYFDLVHTEKSTEDLTDNIDELSKKIHEEIVNNNEKSNNKDNSSFKN